ncbi:hypothetical protein GWK47_028330 [Chionoecetes opilio]|uniref:Uncharacterized protein n=1 Tax=Chionoecetes opilio TaxID=41210 RepID=A0A8J4YP89_CHIOP|nr:hypothetical protein GWK47_028330 [Chionoecetes opilio]
MPALMTMMCKSLRTITKARTFQILSVLWLVEYKLRGNTLLFFTSTRCEVLLCHPNLASKLAGLSACNRNYMLRETATWKVEAAVITTSEVASHRKGFVTLSQVAARLILSGTGKAGLSETDPAVILYGG